MMTGGGLTAICRAAPPGHRRLVAHRFGDLGEIARLAEVLIDRGEADVGDMVERFQAMHHRLADGVGGDFVAARFQLALDAAHQPVDLGGVDVALAAGVGDRPLELGAVERLALAVLLEHGEVAQLDPLEGGEARAAAFALRAAAGSPRRLPTGGCPSPGCLHARKTGSASRYPW